MANPIHISGAWCAPAKGAKRAACALLILACTTTGAFAGYAEGAAAFQRGQYEAAFRELLPLAEQGDPNSEWLVAVMYRDRLGVPKRDKAAALKFMRSAAEHGVPYAMFDLGEAYSYGTLVGQDSKEALQWFTRAAEQGSPQFELTLGMMYYGGDPNHDVPQSSDGALHWLRLSAAHNFAPAEYVLGVAFEEGRIVPRDVAQAIEWYRRAAEQGVAEAQGSLGDLLYRGGAVAQDCPAAMKWLQAAANQGVSYAQYLLGRIYEKGDCAARDVVLAHLWYDNAGFTSCGYIRIHALDRRNGLEEHMTKQQFAEAEELWRQWKPTGAPTFLRHGDERFHIYYLPSIDWPRPYCGWSSLD